MSAPIVLAGFSAAPALAQGGMERSSPSLAVLPLPGLLGGLCLLLTAALLWLALQLRQQRGHARQLAAQEHARSDQLHLQNARLEAALLEKAQLEHRLREQAEAFERLANEDDLSGLPNRRAFDDVLARDMAAARRTGRSLSLAVLSIDHLKQINAQWSRAVGDLVLCEVGDLMRRSLRASDMPARLGNKEFAVLLSDTALPEAEIACRRLQRLFGQYAEWGGHEAGDIKVSFSAGVVQLGEDDQAPVLFYQRAKNALAQAKKEGRARTCAA
ncbi:MAG: GGDEF domain-containing protein [Stenotrophomonas sp.]